MKLCPKCGYSNEDFSAVCSSCGSPLNDDTEATGQFNTYESANLPMQAKTNGFAIASLILGISSVACCCIGVLTGILAVVFGFLAKSKISSSNELEKGNGMALAGIILGFVGIGVALVVYIYYFVCLGFASTSFNEYY